jgi:acetone carboxylase gamma subunit
MGTLTPGATYIYERADGKIYAREFGSTDRKLVGYDSGNAFLEERNRWLTELNEVIIMCETDNEMRELLEKLFILYNLKKHE